MEPILINCYGGPFDGGVVDGNFVKARLRGEGESKTVVIPLERKTYKPDPTDKLIFYWDQATNDMESESRPIYALRNGKLHYTREHASK